MNTALSHSAQLDSLSPSETAFSAPVQWKSRLAELLNHHCTGRELITALKAHPRLECLFQADSRVRENYTIEEHTEFVLNQFDKYLSGRRLVDGLTQSEFRLILALHDIGKSIPTDLKDQHRETIAVIESLIEYLPLTPRAWEIGRALIDNDVLGSLIQGELQSRASIEARQAIGISAAAGTMTAAQLFEFMGLVTFKESLEEGPHAGNLAAAAEKVRSIAQQLSLDPHELFLTMVAFYQADTSAYSYDAQIPGRRASPGLDFLYDISWENSSDGEALPDPLFEVLRGEARFTNSHSMTIIADPNLPGLAFSWKVGWIVSRLSESVSNPPLTLSEEARTAKDALTGLALTELSVQTLQDRTAKAEVEARFRARLASAKRDLEREFSTELREATRRSTEAAQRERSEVTSRLNTLADLAWNGEFGPGKLTLIVDRSADELEGPAPVQKRSDLKKEGREFLVRLVSITDDREAQTTVALQRKFRGNLRNLEHSSYGRKRGLIAPDAKCIETHVAEALKERERWEAPQLAILPVGEIKAAEARELFARTFQSIGDSFEVWSDVLGEHLDTAASPGDTLRWQIHGRAYRGFQHILTKLPGGRWAAMAAQRDPANDISEWTGEYDRVEHACRFRILGAVDVGATGELTLAAARIRSAKSDSFRFDELTAEEQSFLRGRRFTGFADGYSVFGTAE